MPQAASEDWKLLWKPWPHWSYTGAPLQQLAACAEPVSRCSHLISPISLTWGSELSLLTAATLRLYLGDPAACGSTAPCDGEECSGSWSSEQSRKKRFFFFPFDLKMHSSSNKTDLFSTSCCSPVHCHHLTSICRGLAAAWR